jgi:outer membrane receptor protein involved in Fe transport
MKFSRWIFYADVVAYLSRYTNLIEFSTVEYSDVPQVVHDKYPNAFIFQQAKNVTRAQIWGIEASAIGTGAIFGVPLNFLIGYNYMSPRDLDYNPKNPLSHQYLPYRMKHSAKADIQTTYKGFIVGFTGVYIGHVLQQDHIASLIQVGDWINAHGTKGDFVLDARLGYNYKDRFTTTFIAKNITNRAYTLRPGFVEAPANLTLQVTYKWGKFASPKKGS